MQGSITSSICSSPGYLARGFGGAKVLPPLGASLQGFCFTALSWRILIRASRSELEFGLLNC